jgi:hypothetical protein
MDRANWGPDAGTDLFSQYEPMLAGIEMEDAKEIRNGRTWQSAFQTGKGHNEAFHLFRGITVT